MSSRPPAPTAPALAPEELVRHRRFLSGLAGALLADEHAAEDLVQESFLAALTHPPESERALRSWLARVAHNLASNGRRGARRRDERERAVARADAVPGCDEIVERLDLQRRVVAAVRALREPYRGTIYLRWYEGLAPAAIAERLGLPLETVRSRLRRGLERLRAELDERCGGRSAWIALLAPLARRRARIAPVPVGAGLGLLAASAALLAAGEIALPARARALEPTARLERDARASIHAIDAREPAPPRAALAPSLPALVERESAAIARPVRGRVVDARTGEPVPELDLFLRDRDGAEHALRTDADGGFASGHPLVSPFDARLADGVDASPVACDPLRGTPSELAVAAEIGPTFELELDPLFGVDASELRARLVWPTDSGALDATPWTSVRGGARAWVRFASLPAIGLAASGGRSAWGLEVERSDGFAIGRARVHALPGVHREAVRVELAPAGALSGRALEPCGAPIAGSSVRLRRDERDEREGPARCVATDAEGRFRATGLEPGAWTVALDSRLHAASQAASRVAIEPERACELELRAAPLDVAPLEGWLESESGAHEPRGFVRALSVEDPKLAFAVRAEPVAIDGRTRHRFRFDALPLGEYELFPPQDDAFAWKPSRLRVRVPARELGFTCSDDEPGRELLVRARDAASGAALDRFRFTLLADPHDLGSREALRRCGAIAARDVRSDDVVLARLPHRTPLHWLIEKEGYRSARGDARALRREGERLVIEVALEESFCASLWIGTRDEHGRPRALAGARVETAGGRLLATSLGDGRATLELAYDPGRIEVRLDGWRVVDWEGFRRGRALAALDPHRVWMERDAGDE